MTLMMQYDRRNDYRLKYIAALVNTFAIVKEKKNAGNPNGNE